MIINSDNLDYNKMMNIIKKITYILALGAALFTATSCSDPDDELTSVEYDRLFKPTAVEAKVQNKTNVRLSWQCLSKAESYTVQLFADDTEGNFAGEPTFEFTDVTDIPYTISGLAGETTYAIRIKAVGTSKESNWATSSVTTDAEQIFSEVTDDDITAKTVTLKWTPGVDVTSIAITGGKEETYTLSDEEKQNGTATISGLDYETKYTFTIMNGSKARGKVTVTTMPNYTPAYPGSDLQALIDATEDGGTVMLLPAKDGSTNEFTYTGDDGAATTKELIINKNISIKCLGTKPVKARIKFVLDGATSFTTENINFTGVAADALIKTTNCSGIINVNNIEASGYGNFIVDPGENVCTVNEVNVSNSYFHDMCASKRFVDSQKKKCAILKFNMDHCTVANSCTGSDFIRFDYNANQKIEINFTNNTLYKIEATSKGLFYIRSNKAGDKFFTANIKNNVFAEMSAKVFFSQDAKTDNLIFANNCYYNAGTLQANVDGGAGKVFDTTGLTIDPGFKDSTNGDFTITNETLTDKNIGNIK